MGLQLKKLGSTGIEVSIIGLGTVKLGRNTNVKYPTPFEIPDDKAAANLLAVAKDLGINLLDTAPAYGDSEARLGKLLFRQRHKWIIVSKAGEEYRNKQSTYEFTSESIIKSIKSSLIRLHTDYLDLLLIHSNGLDKQLIEQFDVFSTLEKAKQQGMIRDYGMSTKTVEGGILSVQHSDVTMLTYNPCYTNELKVIQLAEHLKKGILIKKAFSSGHLDRISTHNPIQTSINFILRHSGISSIIVGTINPAHLQEAVNHAISV